MAKTKNNYGEVHWNFHTQAVYTNQARNQTQSTPVAQCFLSPSALMFSILLYYSHFLTLVLLASLWSREEQLKDIHQSTLVLLCLRVTGNVLRIGHCCPSGSSQTQVLEAGFLALSIQSGEFKCHVHKCYTFRNPYNGLT